MRVPLFLVLFLITVFSYALNPQYYLTRPVESVKIQSHFQDKLKVINESSTLLVWVAFTDKGFNTQNDYSIALEKVKSAISVKTLKRRVKMKSSDSLIDFLDIPVNDKYISEIKMLGIKVRTSSRWFNAVSVEVNQQQIKEITQFPFVVSLEPVEIYTSPRDEDNTVVTPIPLSPYSAMTDSPLSYGSSSIQIYQINVQLLHQLGYHGEGVIVGMLDTGAEHNTHEAMTSIHVLMEYDFINNDTITHNESGDPSGQDDHGTHTLSILGGQKSGQLYGPAFKSDFLIAKTERVDVEVMAEEDYWVAGLEWEETNGADVVSSSLAYFNFTDGTTIYTYADMNGSTYTVTKGAEVAYQLGVVVCNAMGNNGADISFPYMNSPADGFHVVSVGAVSNTGTRASFSAIGPTYDNRTKPDVMALGVNDYYAIRGTTASYGIGSGTSYSTPLTAGVAALLIQIHPTWTPQNVLDALRSTASQHLTPDNNYGWGIVNAYSASQYTPTVNIPDWTLYQ